MNNKVLMDNLRSIPDFPKKGINFRDVTTLYKNAECVKIMLDELEAIYKDKGITKIVGIESRGFVMASALAGRLGCGIVLARKPGKLPSTVIKESFSKEYGVDTIEMHIDSIDENDVVLIHDVEFVAEFDAAQRFFAGHGDDDVFSGGGDDAFGRRVDPTAFRQFERRFVVADGEQGGASPFAHAAWLKGWRIAV